MDLDALVHYLRRVAINPWPVVAIELFLIGLVVYWATDFLEGTRGERLFRGVILILVSGFIILKLVAGHFAFGLGRIPGILVGTGDPKTMTHRMD